MNRDFLYLNNLSVFTKYQASNDGYNWNLYFIKKIKPKIYSIENQFD